MKCRVVALAGWSLVVAAVLAGCGASTPEADIADLKEDLQRKLPAGWKIATAKEVGFQVLPPTTPESLVVYKVDPVQLEDTRAGLIIDVTTSNPNSAAPPTIDDAPPPTSRAGEVRATESEKGATSQGVRTGHIYYALVLHPFIEPDAYAEQYKKNEAIKKEHKRVLSRIASVPRDEKGNYMPRGVPETTIVPQTLEEYRKLPPYLEHMPTHYYGNTAFKLHDFRVQLLPLDRELQQEQNRVYALLTEKLQRYSTR